MARGIMAGLLLVGCTAPTSEEEEKNGDDTGGPSEDAVIEVTITSPSKGDSFMLGDEVRFKVEATADGKKTNIKSATWTSGDWTKSGTDVTTDELPAGELTIEVEAEVGKDTYTDSVKITVTEPPPLDYRGTADIKIDVDYDGFELTDRCPGNLNFVLDGSAFSGTGSCTDEQFGETFQFTITGALTGKKISGDLSLNIDGTDYPTPFDGTGGYDEAFNATFDQTVREGGNSVRVYGSWTASPVGN
jgi:hypothetical protein